MDIVDLSIATRTEDQVPDIFTKALPMDKFQYLIKLMDAKQQATKRVGVKVNALLFKNSE